MNIKVNIVELASELANDRVYEQLTAEYIDESTVYKTDSKIVEYTEFGQKLFDGWYDYYYNFINKYKID
jgi:3-hydroxyacyl-CoA dehydrogenase